MTLCKRTFEGRQSGNTFLVARDCHPQTIEVVKTRAEPLGLKVVVGDPAAFEFGSDVFAVLVQYPTTDGIVRDLGGSGGVIERAHRAGALVVVASDLLALTLLRSPGELGADVCVGNSQRFGVPLFCGGSSASRRTRRARRRCGSRCRRASSTSAATARPATSARRRCCSP
jgi:glycine dehydrogenase